MKLDNSDAKINQISGLVSVAEVDGCKSASWPWEKTAMGDVREEQ